MSFLGRIFGTAAGETVKGLAEGVGSLALDIRSAITGDMRPETRAALETLALQADSVAQQGQTEINKMEAQSFSLFVAGWRPFIGWICGLALGWHFVVHPLVVWYMTIWYPKVEPPPQLSLGELMPIVLGMLGLGVYRSYEKTKDAQRRH